MDATVWFGGAQALGVFFGRSTISLREPVVHGPTSRVKWNASQTRPPLIGFSARWAGIPHPTFPNTVTGIAPPTLFKRDLRHSYIHAPRIKHNLLLNWQQHTWHRTSCRLLRVDARPPAGPRGTPRHRVAAPRLPPRRILRWPPPLGLRSQPSSPRALSSTSRRRRPRGAMIPRASPAMSRRLCGR